MYSNILHAFRTARVSFCVKEFCYWSKDHRVLVRRDDPNTHRITPTKCPYTMWLVLMRFPEAWLTATFCRFSKTCNGSYILRSNR